MGGAAGGGGLRMPGGGRTGGGILGNRLPAGIKRANPRRVGGAFGRGLRAAAAAVRGAVGVMTNRRGIRTAVRTGIR